MARTTAVEAVCTVVVCVLCSRKSFLMGVLIEFSKCRTAGALATIAGWLTTKAGHFALFASACPGRRPTHPSREQ